MTTKFTNDHEWINIENHEAAIVGITLLALDALGVAGAHLKIAVPPR